MKKLYRRSISGLMALLICFTTILGGGITAFAASSSGEVAKSYSIGFPRSGDANLDYSGTWGHDELHYMNGWTSGEATWMTTLHTIGSFDGPACYCIEPGVPRLLEKTYTRYGEDYWKNYPSDYNSTIDADTIKTLLGRIMQYGYQGDLSLDWRSQNESDADKMAHMMATQVLVWETVVGERDANFNHVDPGSADAVKSVYRTSHPLYSRFSAYYDSIEASVQNHTVIPSFMSKTPNKAQTVELKWDGSQYTATLTDSNHVVSDYTFSSNLSDIVFTTNGNTLTITAKTAPAEPVTISASKNNIRKGVVVWSDGHYGPDGTMQDVTTYAATVMDPVQAFLNLKVSYGSAKIVKASEDGKVDNLTFTVTGNGINQTVKTNSKGEIQIDNLMPGVYTVTEMDYDKYEPQESRRVTVVSGQVSTVNFNNKLKRGDLQIVKSSEDNLNEGVTFHLYGTSLSGIAVDEYAVTDASGIATFEDVLISGSTPYTVEEVDTVVRYVVPEAQSALINWNEVTNRSFTNILKKFTVTVTKSDAETGTAQGDASLAGAVYGIYKGETLVDTYTTDQNGQFVSKEYVCDDDWTVREITPSEGYLLDTTVHKVGAEPQLYTVEHNQTANDVTEQVAKGNIAIIKHTDNGDTQIETPESGAEFAVYLKAAGSYEVAEDTERDYLTCDENGFAQTKDMPYGIYTVHQVSGWEGSELMPDFDVFISQNGATYRYLINNAPFNSFIKIVKQDAETGKTIPYAGAGFKIYDPDGNPVTMTFTYPTPTTIDVFYTNAEGSLVTPEKLSFGKGYSIVEVQAPYGYVLDETPVYFDVTEDNSTEESGVMAESKSRLLYILKYLWQNTDAEHYATTADILAFLKGNGISCDRKTIPGDIAKLCDIGIDIEEERSRENRYSLSSHLFTLPELKLLIDAVESSKFITVKKSAELIEKLSQMTSIHQAAELKSNLYVSERVKPLNEQIYYLVDNINTAINRGKQISFRYFHYDQHRKEVPNNDGKRYFFSPYCLVWNEDHYYAIGYSEKHRKLGTFRVDRMKEVEILSADAAAKPADFNLPEFTRRVFDMYDGETKKVTLVCKNDLMNYIVDRFGDEVDTVPGDCGHFRAVAEVSVSQTFFAWVFQFNGDIRITAPEEVVLQYGEMLKNALQT